MKVEHVYTDFKFIVNGNAYHVICFKGKRGDNTFKVYDSNNKHIADYSPRGGHVNKTNAEMVLRRTIV